VAQGQIDVRPFSNPSKISFENFEASIVLLTTGGMVYLTVGLGVGFTVVGRSVGLLDVGLFVGSGVGSGVGITGGFRVVSHASSFLHPTFFHTTSQQAAYESYKKLEPAQLVGYSFEYLQVPNAKGLGCHMQPGASVGFGVDGFGVGTFVGFGVGALDGFGVGTFVGFGVGMIIYGFVFFIQKI
jgi:hypothetical protein